MRVRACLNSPKLIDTPVLAILPHSVFPGLPYNLIDISLSPKKPFLCSEIEIFDELQVLLFGEWSPFRPDSSLEGIVQPIVAGIKVRHERPHESSIFGVSLLKIKCECPKAANRGRQYLQVGIGRGQ